MSNGKMSKMIRRAAVITVAALLGLAALPAQAITRGYGEITGEPGFWDDPRGFVDRPHAYLGVRGVGMIVSGQSTDFDSGPLDDGGGFGLFAGVKLGAITALEFNWTTTWHGQELDLGLGQPQLLRDVYLMTFTGDIKIHFPTPIVMDPYLLVGGGYAILGAEYEDGFGLEGEKFADGGTFEVGGGLNIWLTRNLSVGGKIFYRGIYFTEPDFADRLDLPGHSNYVSGVVLDVDLIIHL